MVKEKHMRKEMKKKLTAKAKRSTAVVLTFLMVFMSVHWDGISFKDVFAAQEETEEAGAADVPVSKSDAITSENTVDSTTFDLGNGKKKIVFYGSDVRYEEGDGTLTDYDPTLVRVTSAASENGEDLSGYLYENKTGDKKQYLPKELSDETPVILENGKDSLSFVPVLGENGSDAEGEIFHDPDEDNSFAGTQQEGTPELKKETVSDAYEQEKEKRVTAVYDMGSEMDLSYQSMENGVKETIVLNSCPETNRFTFELKTGGLVPEKCTENEGIVFLDPVTGKEKAVMAPPNMNDATEEAYSEDITCEIEEKAGEEDTYLISYIVDQAYLTDEERQYPVSIDPTLTWSGTAQLKDVYVCNGSTYKNMNFYNSDIVITMAGKAAQGVYRSYMKFMDLDTRLDGYHIDSATLSLYEASGSQSGQTITAHQVKGPWVLGDITWSTQPSYAGTALSSFKTVGTAGTVGKLDVTELMTNIMAKGDKNYGLMIRNKNESSSFGKFYGTRNSTSSRRPKLSVVVSDKPATPSNITLSSSYGKPGDKVTVSWAGITSSGLDRVEYRIARVDADGTELGNIVSYADSGTKIGNTASGSAEITIPACSGYEEAEYKIVVRGVDDQGNKGSGKSKRFHMDAKNPLFDASKTKLLPATSASEPTTDLTPELSWELTESNLKALSYSVTCGGEQTGQGSLNAALTGTASLPASCFGNTGEYVVVLEAEDKAGNTASSVPMYYHVGEIPVDLSGYVPASGSLKIRQQYGKNTLFWECASSQIPNNISWRIYRGDSSNFSMNEDSLVAEEIREKHWTDMETPGGSTYYYKIQVVQISASGGILAKENGPDTVHAGAVSEDSYDSDTGSKEWKSYFSFDNAAGSGTVDQKSGNLSYSQTDAEISAAVGSLGLTRTYNSLSGLSGMFGNGWSDSFHKELTKNSAGDFCLTEGDGTVFRFTKDGNAYDCAESADYELYTKGVDGVQLVSGASDAQEEELPSAGLIGYVAYPVREEYTDADGETAWSVSYQTRYHEYSVKSQSTVYRFNRKGRLVAEVDANNNFLLYDYNNDGTLKSVTTSGGKKISLSYNADGLAVKALLPDGTYLDYGYDSSHNLVSVKHWDKNGSKKITCTYTYGTGGLSSVSDFEGNVQTVTYSSGRVTAVTYADGETYAISYENGKTSVTKTGAGQTKPIWQTEVSYDEEGKTLSEIDAAGKATSYTYGYTGNPYLVTKKESSEPYQYLDGDKVVFSAYMRTETMEYDSEERLVKEEMAEAGNKETTVYTYPSVSAAGEWNEDLEISKTTQMQDADGTELEEDIDYTYDDAGNLLMEEDAFNEEKTVYAYDDDGNETSSHSYTTDTGILTGDVLTQTGTAEYDADGNVVYEETIAAPESSNSVTSSTDLVYDEMGRTVKNTDEKGNVTETAYDWLGRAVKTTETRTGEEGQSVVTVTDTTYHDNGTVDTEAVTGGVTSAYTYDTQGRVTRLVQSEGDHIRTTTHAYGYDTISLDDGIDEEQAYVYKETVNAPSGTSVTYTNGAGETVRTIEGGITTDSIIRNGEAVGSIVNGKISLTLKNEQGQETASVQNAAVSGSDYVVGADSLLTRSIYDTSGNTAEESDAKGIRTEYSYDDRNRITSVKQDAGGRNRISSISYSSQDGEGDATVTLTDAKGHKNITKMNAAGLTVSVEDKGDGSESILTAYDYDDRGNLVKETFADGSYKEYTYSKRDLLSEMREYKDGALVRKTVYGYDVLERRVRMSDYTVNGSVVTPYRHTFCDYDKWGRLSYEAEVDTDREFDELTSIQTAAGKTTYGYDDADRLVSITFGHPDGDIRGLKIFYDSYGREKTVKAVSKAGGATKENVLRTYEYDSLGRVSRVTDCADFATDAGVTVVKSYTYDNLDRVLTMTYRKGQDTIGSFSYTYDKNSNILTRTEKDDSVSGAETDFTRTYTYDTLGQLTKTVTDDRKTGEVSSILYTYDDAGNRLTTVSGEERTDYTYNGLDQLTKSVTTKGGTKTSDETYTYDACGNETGVADSVTGTAAASTYDPSGRLTSRILSQNGAIVLTQENAYNGDGQRIRKSENGTDKHYHYMEGLISYVTDGDGNKIMQYLSGGSSIIAAESLAEDGSATYLYTKDIQNSTKDLIGADGNGVTAYQYDDFGETTADGQNGTGNEVCYTGGVYDESTGLYYLNARYYDPENGRFLTEDTYRGEENEPDTWHLYAYCNNDPVNYLDPSGHNPISIVVSAVGAISGISALWPLIPITIGVICWKRGYFKKGSKTRNKIVRNVKKSFSKIRWVSQEKAAIMTSICISVARSKLAKKFGKDEKHHIVAQKAYQMEEARELFKRHTIGINSSKNLVLLDYRLHRRLHRNLYYSAANKYITKQPNKKANVIDRLAKIKRILKAANQIVKSW